MNFIFYYLEQRQNSHEVYLNIQEQFHLSYHGSFIFLLMVNALITLITINLNYQVQ